MISGPSKHGSWSIADQPRVNRPRRRRLFTVAIAIAVFAAWPAVYAAGAEAQTGDGEGSGAAHSFGSATSTRPLDSVVLAAVDDLRGRLTARDAQIAEMETRLETLEGESGFGDRIGPVTSFQITWALLLVGGTGVVVAASRSGKRQRR